MEQYSIVKRLGFVLLIILLLSGCSKIDHKKSLQTTSSTTVSTTPATATNIPTLEPSPSIEPTVLASTPTPSFHSLSNSEDNMTNSEPTKEDTTKEEVNDELCSENEDILISFKIVSSDKRVSICISKQEPGYIVYRYGKPEDIELEYPNNTESFWDEFTYSYYLRGGGAGNAGVDLNYLYFINEDYKYEIYEEYDSETAETLVGITVTDLKTGEETDIQGDGNSINGSLIALRDNDKVKRIIYDL